MEINPSIACRHEKTPLGNCVVIYTAAVNQLYISFQLYTAVNAVLPMVVLSISADFKREQWHLTQTNQFQGINISESKIEYIPACYYTLERK